MSKLPYEPPNIFTSAKQKGLEIERIKDLAYRLKDYTEEYSEQPYMHEAYLQVLDKLDDLGAEL